LTGVVAVARTAAALVGLAIAVAACGGDDADGAAFCGRLEQQQGLLSGAIGTPAEVSAAVEAFRELGRLAPAAIEEPWDRLTSLVEEAATLDLAQPEALDRLRDLSYESQGAADDVSDWARATCGLELRPATTLGPVGVIPTEPATAAG
jgi:hypothetical protein